MLFDQKTYGYYKTSDRRPRLISVQVTLPVSETRLVTVTHLLSVLLWQLLIQLLLQLRWGWWQWRCMTMQSTMSTTTTAALLLLQLHLQQLLQLQLVRRIPPACVRDLDCNRDLVSISTSYLDPWPVSETRRLCETQLLTEVLRYLKNTTLLISRWCLAFQHKHSRCVYSLQNIGEILSCSEWVAKCGYRTLVDLCACRFRMSRS